VLCLCILPGILYYPMLKPIFIENFRLPRNALILLSAAELSTRSQLGFYESYYSCTTCFKRKYLRVTFPHRLYVQFLYDSGNKQMWLWRVIFSVDIMSCSPSKIIRNFGRKRCFHLQSSVCWLLHAFSWAASSILKIKATCSAETPVDCQRTIWYSVLKI
jgi:hypothetical protein